MREIKFRVWDRTDNRMWTAIQLDWVSDSEALRCWVQKGQSSDHGVWLDADEFALLQFTGLKDKNGVEIYQGDLMRYYKDVFVVIFQEMNAAFEMAYVSESGVSMHTFRSLSVAKFCEVVGNIYENPELLAPVDKPVETP